MSQIKQMSVQQLHDLLDAGPVNVLDIRDEASYDAGHVPNAVPLSRTPVEQCMEKFDKDQTLVVCCYHGISSIEAAMFFSQQGFADVHSLMGGYEAWHRSYSEDDGME
ncbi:rhodanese-like domain-containing protein [Nitrospina watsonii]|uniref:Thiosulfate sulfurtransferase GlpE n=1 Tax=Nitrospina watsonii TaxID=1323948 RepID=A0ABM9HEN2_9BACT|nr:rhodanese-like domain-containing protein [Nitrospina watsonii]CAI2718603.1 Thiosulfate sulfurtransferase GlpE [Nitrospina watsonii]